MVMRRPQTSVYGEVRERIRISSSFRCQLTDAIAGGTGNKSIFCFNYNPGTSTPTSEINDANAPILKLKSHNYYVESGTVG